MRRSCNLAGALLITVLLAACGGSGMSPVNSLAHSPDAARGSGVQYAVLHSFGASEDGANPYAVLLNVDGTLYGTTAFGGENGNGEGTVFALKRSGAETVLYRFAGSGEGEQPRAGLVNVKGTLYGTTPYGGANDKGTVFSVTTSGTVTVLHNFGGSGDGANPYAGLLNVNGTLYGTTLDGGASREGTVFAITTPGKESVLHSFAGGANDGANPYAGLLDVDGKLYGTTSLGGANGDGTVFVVTTSGGWKVVHSFGGSGDGAYAFAPLLRANGKLYGMTERGGANDEGTVFAIAPPGAESVIHSFGASGDGAFPYYANLLEVKDKLYGTTFKGGANGDGTVFAIATSGAESVRYSFKGGSGDGAYPEAGLLQVKGALYGTTALGGANDAGVLFSLTP